MKKILFTFISIILFASKFSQLSAQTPNYLWAKSSGGTGNEYGNSCINDANGNTIVTGSFESVTITFDTIVLTNNGASSMFLVKYDPNGNVLWAKTAVGSLYDYGNACTVDASGNIIITGDFSSPTISFDSTVLNNVNVGSPEMFIVKYDPNGNVLWAKSASGTDMNLGGDCTTDATGNIIVTAWYYGTLTIDTITFTNMGYSDFLIVKYDSNGNLLWAKSVGGTLDDTPQACTIDGSGNIIITGCFSSPTLTFGSTTLNNSGGYDVFILKCDSLGNPIWASSTGGIVDDDWMTCSTDAAGNIIAAGVFKSPTILFGTTLLSNSGFKNIFIVKYDSGGNVLWAKAAAGGTFYGLACTTDSIGNIIAIGNYYSSTATIDTITFQNADPSGNTIDLCFVKYDPSGNLLWAASAGGTDDDFAFDCKFDTVGDIFVTGAFLSPILTFGATSLHNVAGDDMFIVKLDGQLGTGINYVDDLKNDMVLFPNPANNYFTIALGKNKNVEVSIIDNTGKTIYKTFATNSQNLEVNTKDFTEGIYLVKIISAGLMTTKKLVIK